MLLILLSRLAGLALTFVIQSLKVPQIVSFLDELSVLLPMKPLCGKCATTHTDVRTLRRRVFVATYILKGIPWLIGNNYFQHQAKYCQCL